jgi:enediyne biosynthesis protein E4
MNRIQLLLIASVFSIFACKQGAESEAKDPNALFVRLEKEQTGVEFKNNLEENSALNYFNYNYIYMGGAVSVGDINNDKLPDLYYSSSMGTNKLYLNKGNMQFEDITEKAGVAAKDGVKTGVTMVDINNDGLIDIYQCRSGLNPSGRSNLLFINKGDMTFEESATKYGLDDQCGTNHANFFDYDKDGDLDMYMLNIPTDFGTVNSIRVEKNAQGELVRINKPASAFESDRLYQNNGNNTFTDVSAKAGIINRAFGLSACVSDFNSDGYLDVYVSNDYVEPDVLYINNKNGTFSNKIGEYLQHTAMNSMGMDAADINNDALVDFVSLDMISEENYYQKELQTPMKKDRYNTMVKYGYGKQQMRNALQLNNGNGTFSDIACLSGISNTDWSWTALANDYDNDGWKDIFITNGFFRDFTNQDYVNFTVDSVRRAGSTSKDINDYMKLVPSHKIQNYMYRNNRDLTFENVAQKWGLSEKTFSNGAAYADLDADGDLDLIVNNQNEPSFIYKNQTRERNLGNYLQLIFEGNPKNPKGTGAKALLRNDSEMQYNELTPTRGFLSSVEQILHFGLGTASIVEELQITWPDGKIQSLKNVTVNQRLVVRYTDAVVGKFPPIALGAPIFKSGDAAAMGLDFQHHENEFDDFNREFLLPHKYSTQGPSIASGDVNGDGLEDVYVGGASGQPGKLYLQTQASTFRSTTNTAFDADQRNEDVASIFFDADGDKDLDLYVASGGNEMPVGDVFYQDRLYINDGKGNFAKSTTALPALYNSESTVSAHDYDNDGDLDIFLGARVTPALYPKTPQSIILQNNNGVFKDITAQVAPEFANVGMVSDLQWIDIDGDKKAELVALGEWMPISIFKYDGNAFKNITSSTGLQNSSGWWNTLRAADFDGDGDMDLVAGNEGMNTRYHASEKEPMQVYAKDFDGNGTIDPILACFNFGKNCPVVQKDELMKQIPSLKKKYLRYRAYANASIFDIYTEKEMKSGISLSANNLKTCYFKNNGGKFTCKALPNEAQFSITKSIECRDFNNDGKMDILLVGNSNYSEVETGPYDASNGCLLLGDGKGGFAATQNRNTGLWANKEARSSTIVALANKQKMLLVANNNDKLQVFKF